MNNKPDTRNKKHVLKEERQEALREQLQAYGLLQQVIKSIEKVDNAGPLIEAIELQAIKFTTDTRLKLLDKILPSLKAVEMSGDLDHAGELSIKWKS